MIFHLLLVVVALSPLPLGSNRPWAWSVCSALVAVLAVAWAVDALRRPSDAPLSLNGIRYSVWLFCFVMVWAVFQTLGATPDAWHHPLWQMAETDLSRPVRAAVSIDPDASVSALMRLLSYGLVFVLTLAHCRRHEKAHAVFRCLSWVGCLYACYGLALYFGGKNTLLWYPAGLSRGDVASTFVNRNSYATYAGITLLCSLALLVDRLSLSSRYDFSGYWGIERLVEIVITRAWLPLLILLTSGTALILSHSRGGFLSTLAASLVLLLVLNVVRGKRGLPVTLGMAGACLVATLVFFTSSAALMERLDQTSLDSEHRLAIFRTTGAAIADNPWLGVGYGAYEEGFRLYKDETLTRRYDKAHNTYLENGFELGVVAASALYLSVLGLASTCLVGVFKRRRDWIYPATGFAATVLVGAHALVDFSLQIPAVAMTYASLMGAACAQAFPSGRRKTRQSDA